MSHSYAARYTVQPMDEAEGLLGLARRFYGDAARWPELYEANRVVIGDNPNILRPGQQLVIPGLSAGPPRKGLVYIVEPGDEEEGLLGLALRFYGDAERWPEIYDLNKGVIGDDPTVIEAGQCLIIARPGDPELDRVRGEAHGV